MQERRTLIYVEKDDIPSSALEWDGTADITGNVLYIPCVPRNALSATIWSADNSTKELLNFSKPQTPSSNTGLTIPIYPVSSSNLTVYLNSSIDPTNTLESAMYPFITKYVSASASIFIFPFPSYFKTFSSTKNYPEPAFDNQFGLYCKLKFSGNIALRKGKVSKKYHIYIDNEE